MTLGGSRFPGALDGMLIEILPFLRGIATDMHNVLGDDHPGLIPTVMAAYALTSFLTGAAFILLGVLKIGNLVAYFPQRHLSLSNAGSALFAKYHLSLLAASAMPAFVLSVTLRSRRIELWTRGFTRSVYHIPVYLLVIPAIFWIAMWAFGFSKEHLITTGWLFAVDTTSASSAVIVAGWNYWSLFDFMRIVRLVEWSLLKSTIQNIVLLVVIGALNLPIYVPTLAFSLDISYDMNHELLGQGAGNIVADVVGNMPNILQYSYSVYVPRQRRAAPKTLAWKEYTVVLSTLVGCTFLGFAEGFGLGIAAAALVYLLYGVVDSDAESHLAEHLATPAPAPGRLLSPRNHTPAAITLEGASSTVTAKTHEDADVLQHVDARVLTTYVRALFASVPSLEKALLAPPALATFFNLDVTRAHRIETAVVRCLPRCVRELVLKGRVLVVYRLARGSGLHADFGRADIPFSVDPAAAGEGKIILAFATQDACLAWCQGEHEKRVALGQDDEAKQSAFKTFSRLFDFELRTELEQFIAAGGRITAYLPGILFVVKGQLNRVAAPEPLDTEEQRPSVRRILSMLPHQTVRAVRAR
ncbi:hypothetical protein B0H17DRAFT_1334728 [Mycena rosella]|uniref:SLC26A/SulP transporter domain-containing protein n=1 Tax=Mycena rosella TaxID=1033263 RepID=A0AAD7D298_MYCRO|nr:hypothetical protein B0H17DRAFT_1334728 [Mycena rosella]